MRTSLYCLAPPKIAGHTCKLSVLHGERQLAQQKPTQVITLLNVVNANQELTAAQCVLACLEFNTSVADGRDCYCYLLRTLAPGPGRFANKRSLGAAKAPRDLLR